MSAPRLSAIGNAYTTRSRASDGYLLDTNAVSELTKLRPNDGLLHFLATVPEYRLFLSVLTIGELVSGICRLPKSNKKRDLWTWLETDLVARFNERMLSVDFACAHLWGTWEAESRISGEVLPAIDTLLAATAFSNGLAIVTRNTKHFNKLNVRVIDPWT